ncbi:MAG TPA: SOS response-associated peptidase [Desertimonas sp.]|nr:SOS response-associated peptidase [Desertimonas sp.]
MCGRFVSSSSPEAIAEYFGATFAGETLGENFNVAPTNDVYGVVADTDGNLRLEVFHWGLVPIWAKDRKVGAKMINARAETLAEKPAYKGIFRKHRCLIPMDGFYEWKAGTPDGPLTAKGKPAKQPMYFESADGEPLAVAGLWTAWRDPAAGDKGAWLHSTSVITTSANSTMRPVHDRMPVILPKSLWAEWLDPDNHDTDRLGQLLLPAGDDVLTVHAVKPDVNNVRNNGPELIAPIED